MIELNLLPDVKRQFIAAARAKRKVVTMMIFVSIGSAGIVALLALHVYGIQALQGAALDSSVKKSSAKLSEVADLNNYLTIQNQLGAVSALHEDKGLYSRLFTILPTLSPASPSNISITKLDIDNELGVISIEGYGADYSAVNVFENTLRNAEVSYSKDDATTVEKLFSDVLLSDVSLGEDAEAKKVTVFKVALPYTKAVFERTAANVLVTVPNKDATTSTQQIPQELFSPGGQPAAAQPQGQAEGAQ